MMKKETKQRIAIFCTGITLAVVAAVAGSSLTDLLWLINHDGWPRNDFLSAVPAEMDWLVDWIIGRNIPGVLFLLSPALLTMATFHTVWRTPLGRLALMAIVLSFFIGVSFRLSAEMIDSEIIVKIVWPLTCIAIVVAVELLMRKELQAKDS